MFLDATEAVALFIDATAQKPYTQLSKAPGHTAGALICSRSPSLSPQGAMALERMGYADPFRVHTLFTSDGGSYDHTAALHGVAKCVESHLARTHTAGLWDVRGALRAWNWWALRDGFVGLPFERVHRFLAQAYWPYASEPAEPHHQGIPVLVLPGRSHSAHARLAAQGRILDDLAIALAHDAPNTRVVATDWVT